MTLAELSHERQLGDTDRDRRSPDASVASTRLFGTSFTTFYSRRFAHALAHPI